MHCHQWLVRSVLQQRVDRCSCLYLASRSSLTAAVKEPCQRAARLCAVDALCAASILLVSRSGRGAVRFTRSPACISAALGVTYRNYSHNLIQHQLRKSVSNDGGADGRDGADSPVREGVISSVVHSFKEPLLDGEGMCVAKGNSSHVCTTDGHTLSSCTSLSSSVLASTLNSSYTSAKVEAKRQITLVDSRRDRHKYDGEGNEIKVDVKKKDSTAATSATADNADEMNKSIEGGGVCDTDGQNVGNNRDDYQSKDGARHQRRDPFLHTHAHVHGTRAAPSSSTSCSHDTPSATISSKPAPRGEARSLAHLTQGTTEYVWHPASHRHKSEDKMVHYRMLALRRRSTLYSHASTFGMPEGYPDTTADGFRRFFYLSQGSAFVSNFSSSIGYQSLLSGFFLAASPQMWMLKDLIPALLAAYMANRVVSYENRPKFWFCVSVFMSNVTVMTDMLIPTLAPNYLVLAAITTSTIKQSASLMYFIARASALQHFSINNNLADITKKFNSFGMVNYTIASALGIVFCTYMASFPVQVATALVCCAVNMVLAPMSMNFIAFRILNFTTISLIMRSYIQHNTVLSPEQVSDMLGVRMKLSFDRDINDMQELLYISPPLSKMHIRSDHLDRDVLFVSQEESFMLALWTPTRVPLTLRESWERWETPARLRGVRGAVYTAVRAPQRWLQALRCKYHSTALQQPSHNTYTVHDAHSSSSDNSELSHNNSTSNNPDDTSEQNCRGDHCAELRGGQSGVGKLHNPNASSSHRCNRIQDEHTATATASGGSAEYSSRSCRTRRSRAHRLFGGKRLALLVQTSCRPQDLMTAYLIMFTAILNHASSEEELRQFIAACYREQDVWQRAASRLRAALRSLEWDIDLPAMDHPSFRVSQLFVPESMHRDRRDGSFTPSFSCSASASKET